MNPNHRSRRGGFLAALAVSVVLVFLFVGYVFWCGRDYARVSFPQKYWLLVRDCEDTTAAAVTGQSYISGGAGYYLETEREQSVALACYYRESTAQSVQRNMREKGVETRLLVLSPPDLSLSGSDAAQAKRIAANAETLDSCARILYDTANGLERATLSQEEARAAVKGVTASLKGLSGGNDGSFYATWNGELEKARRRGVELAQGILFAKDLRYLQIELCVLVANVNNYF